MMMSVIKIIRVSEILTGYRHHFGAFKKSAMSQDATQKQIFQADRLRRRSVLLVVKTSSQDSEGAVSPRLW